MMFWLIIGGLVALAVALGILAAVFINYDGKGERASGERHFRADKAQPVTLPLRLPEVVPHRDQVAAAWGRPWIYNDLPGPYSDDHGRDPQIGRAVIGKAVRPSPGEEAPRAGELAPHVVAALTRAGSEDTVVTSHDLEAVIGGDPWDGLGSADAWLDRLFSQVGAR